MDLWLHEIGYNYFTIPKLTYIEINGLVKAYNRKMKTQQREMKKASRKRK